MQGGANGAVCLSARGNGCRARELALAVRHPHALRLEAHALEPALSLSAKDGVMLRDASARRADLPAPVEGPSVWYGPEIAKGLGWGHVLSAADVAEIGAAMRPLVDREADIARIRKADFPLPTVAPKLAAIRREVIEGRGFALLRGLPVERWSIRESATAYFGIGTHFGS